MSAGWPAQLTEAALTVSMPAVPVTWPTVTQNSPFLFRLWPEDHRQYSLRLPTKGWPD